MTIEASAPPVTLRPIDYADRDEFLAMVRASRELHRPWAYPPERPDQFDELVARSRRDDVVTLLACRADGGEIAGVFTISQIVRGAFQSAFLGYYGNARHARRGYMRAGMQLVLDHAFGTLRLHRLEANIQPGNLASIAVARKAGFVREGFSERYLKVGGRWRDHERWAIRADQWRARR